MKRINASAIALGLVAIGLLLGTAALLSAYDESGGGVISCTARHENIEGATPPRS
jgi:hypothetical protein